MQLVYSTASADRAKSEGEGEENHKGFRMGNNVT